MPKIKTARGMENRKVVSQKEWLAARKKLLAKEKKFSKLRDELNLQRRKLPWVKIEKEYIFIVQPYLFFNGRCVEALELHRKSMSVKKLIAMFATVTASFAAPTIVQAAQ